MEELHRTPLALLFGGISAATGAVAVIIAGHVGGPQFDAPSSSTPVAAGSYLLVLAAFLGLTTTAALISRFAYHLSKASAFFLSILLASVSTLLAGLVTRSQGIRFLTDDPKPTDQTAWVLFWGTLILFLVVNGERVGRDLGSSILSTDGPSSAGGGQKQEAATMDGGHVLVGLAAALIIWATLVWNGTRFLVVPLFR